MPLRQKSQTGLPKTKLLEARSNLSDEWQLSGPPIGERNGRLGAQSGHLSDAIEAQNEVPYPAKLSAFAVPSAYIICDDLPGGFPLVIVVPASSSGHFIGRCQQIAEPPFQSGSFPERAFVYVQDATAEDHVAAYSFVLILGA